MNKVLPKPYQLRLVGQSEEKEIKNLIFSVLKEYGLPVNEQAGPDVDLNDIPKYYSLEAGSPFWVVLDEAEEIVGTMALHRESDHTCELRKMYLSKKARGLGLGKAMMKYVIGVAKELGYKTITLETDSVLKEAVIVYQKFGFVPYHNPHICDRCDTAMKLDIIE